MAGGRVPTVTDWLWACPPQVAWAEAPEDCEVTPVMDDNA